MNNEVSSLLIATTILAIGGLGLYMYKLNDDNQVDENDFMNNKMNFDEDE